MKKLIEKMIEVRRLQKKYFRERDPLTLRACKKAEREIDALLQQYEKDEVKNPKLFD